MDARLHPLAPIRFNEIHGGIVGDLPAWKARPEAPARVRDRTPAGRRVTSEDVVDTVKFLLNHRGVKGVNPVMGSGRMLLWHARVARAARAKQAVATFR